MNTLVPGVAPVQAKIRELFRPRTLVAPIASGIILRDLVTVLRSTVFGWRLPRNGTGLEIFVEMAMIGIGAAICSRLSRVAAVDRPSGWLSGAPELLALAVGYCVFIAPLGVFDPAGTKPLPVGYVPQDVIAVGIAVAAWSLTARQSVRHDQRSPCADEDGAET